MRGIAEQCVNPYELNNKTYTRILDNYEAVMLVKASVIFENRQKPCT